ncbi:MAG: NAD(P)/FAD-dependent oxidoreductase [Parabacteroides sp.]|jgi:NADH dehydrogenase|nr:NAD(P)/FAD-dependent oxidoreductase [Parabacteroides sp.]MBP8760346.1 NAD(P)/FAD-dependent oxidoreductase [Parabacteroides sp.]
MANKKKVVVVGCGFAGIRLIQELDQNLFDIYVIDKLNNHQFQPLFYQVATAQIDPSSISFPLRNVFKRKRNVHIRIAEVTKIDSNNKQVITSIGNFEYDYLVIGIGCKTNFFGNREIEENSLTLKTTSEAIAIRNHVLMTFERIISASPEEKERLLNLVIVGAGPTGVELAGAFAEIKNTILPKDYPDIDFKKLNIILIEGSKHTLNNMSDTAKTSSTKYLRAMGVTVITEVLMTNYDGKTAKLDNGKEIKTGTVIWAAGVTGNKIEGLPETSITRGNRIIVDRYNRVNGCDAIYAIGDIAYMETPKYPKGHPQLANVAINQAKCLAKNLKAIQLNNKLTEFEYKDLGSMATIGNHKAVVDLPFIKFEGYFAWLTWMFLHLMLILSVKNKLIIFLNWAWRYFTKDNSLRLILPPFTNKKQEK